MWRCFSSVVLRSVCVNGSLLTCVLWQPVCCSSLGIIIFTVCFQLSGTCEEIIGVPWLDLLQDPLKTSWCLCPVTHTQSSIFKTLSILFTASIMTYLFLTFSSYFVTGLEIPDISQISDSLVYKSLLLKGWLSFLYKNNFWYLTSSNIFCSKFYVLVDVSI